MAWGSALNVIDATGKTVLIPQPVRRIVAINSDCLEVLRILKAEDRVVGVFSDIVGEAPFWGELAHRPKVGKWNELNLEVIAALAPDLIIAYGGNPDASVENKLRQLGVVMLRLDFYRIATLESEVQILGQVLGKEEEAKRFTDWHHSQFAKIRAAVAASSERPEVYLENYTDLQTVGPGSGGHVMCELAGGRSISSSSSIPFPRVTPEWVVAMNPEVVIKAFAQGNGYAQKDASPYNLLRAAIMHRPAWPHIRAVAQGRVHVIDGAIWTGPRAIIGIAYLASWLHPEMRPSISPETLHREYLQLFHGLSYQGVYVSADNGEKNQ
nr:ABC transporter substrate-binding protein [uncultured Desulfobulbus sp.]